MRTFVHIAQRGYYQAVSKLLQAKQTNKTKPFDSNAIMGKKTCQLTHVKEKLF